MSERYLYPTEVGSVFFDATCFADGQPRRMSPREDIPSREYTSCLADGWLLGVMGSRLHNLTRHVKEHPNDRQAVCRLRELRWVMDCYHSAYRYAERERGFESTGGELQVKRIVYVQPGFEGVEHRCIGCGDTKIMNKMVVSSDGIVANEFICVSCKVKYAALATVPNEGEERG